MPTTQAEVPSGLVVDFDVYDPAVTMPVDRMQELTADLASTGPVVWSTAHGGHWLVTSYEVVHEVLKNHEDFSSYPNNLVDAAQGKFLPLELDPPEHTGYRQALQPLFSPNRMKALETDIRRIVVQLIESFQADGEVEFVSRFAHELPTQVFLALMGLPLSDAPLFTEATEIALNGKPGDSPAQAAKSRAKAAADMFAYFMNVISETRDAIAAGRSETENVTFAIVSSRITDDSGGERPLSDEELGRMFFLLLIAGLHTTQSSLAWMVMHLSSNLDEREKLLDDPSLIPSAIEEVLRFEAATALGRRATRDVEIAGVKIREGDQLLTLVCAANRDSVEFESPGEFDIGRVPNRHLTFGSGPHRCIGSHLARLMLRIAAEELHARIPDYEVDPAIPPVVLPSQVRGEASLSLRFTPVK